MKGRRKIDGVLLLDKPMGLSSSMALQQAKRLLNAEKAGHAGTLDPLATGLLPLLFGEATKFAQYGLDSDKAYLAGVSLGTTTDTGDAEGQVLLTRPVAVDEDRLQAVLAKFRGPIEQVPPMYSALKKEGRPLYELAREGKSVDRPARRVTIHALELLRREPGRLDLHVACSKGTYIRQLAADLGEALGCGAHLDALRRTGAGAFTLDGAVTLDALQALPEGERAALLLPADRLLAGLPRVDLAPAEAQLLLHGQGVPAPGQPAGPCRVYRAGGELLGVAEVDGAGRLHPVRLRAGNPQAAEKRPKTL